MKPQKMSKRENSSFTPLAKVILFGAFIMYDSVVFGSDSLVGARFHNTLSDSIHIKVEGSQLSEVLDSFDGSGLPPEWVGLIGVGAGAILTILAQFLLSLRLEYREKQNMMRELASDERRLAQEIRFHLKELAWLRASAEYWHRYTVLSNESIKMPPPSDAATPKDIAPFAEFTSFRDRIPECRRTINGLLSQYVKSTAKFYMLSGKKAAEYEHLLQVSDDSILEVQSRELKEIHTVDDLESASSHEKARLEEKYLELLEHLKLRRAEIIKCLN